MRPFVDLKAQQQRIRKELDRAICRVLDHGQYIMGPEVSLLEEKLASYVGVKHAVSCSSGTDALLMALMALGVGPGDAVFTTPFTFIATAEVIALAGATPVFVDIDPGTFNMDPNMLGPAIEAVRAGSSVLRPVGVIPVDLFGLPADYDAINATAKDNGLFVLEDAAQSFGAEYKGRKACSLAEVAAASFFPAKPLGCYGDGGAVFTDDDGLAEVLKSLRIHGHGDSLYDHVRIGVNGRMDTLQAAVLLCKLSIFPDEVEKRHAAAALYTQLLADCPQVLAPSTLESYSSVWAQYSIRVPERDALKKYLAAQGIPSAVYYPTPLHLQPAFSRRGYTRGDMPAAEKTAKEILSLPMHPYLTEEDIASVCQAVGDFYNNR